MLPFQSSGMTHGGSNRIAFGPSYANAQVVGYPVTMTFGVPNYIRSACSALTGRTPRRTQKLESRESKNIGLNLGTRELEKSIHWKRERKSGEIGSPIGCQTGSGGGLVLGLAGRGIRFMVAPTPIAILRGDLKAGDTESSFLMPTKFGIPRMTAPKCALEAGGKPELRDISTRTELHGNMKPKCFLSIMSGQERKNSLLIGLISGL